jgi:hypothetical protein
MHKLPLIGTRKIDSLDRTASGTIGHDCQMLLPARADAL